MSRADDLLEQARAGLDRVDPAQAAALQAEGALIVDIRPHANRAAEGEIPMPSWWSESSWNGGSTPKASIACRD
ncbi:hypothetical protein [Nocardia sp. NPDC020380]|uniref:hypothetical protein n=1 Tax=Nocardia sp. NPDC020380 TaxID=3364309 RepID=UPI0037B9E75B